jgi:hypothetical protein
MPEDLSRLNSATRHLAFADIGANPTAAIKVDPKLRALQKEVTDSYGIGAIRHQSGHGVQANMKVKKPSLLNKIFKKNKDKVHSEVFAITNNNLGLKATKTVTSSIFDRIKLASKNVGVSEFTANILRNRSQAALNRLNSKKPSLNNLNRTMNNRGFFSSLGLRDKYGIVENNLSNKSDLINFINENQSMDLVGHIQKAIKNSDGLSSELAWLKQGGTPEEIQFLVNTAKSDAAKNIPENKFGYTQQEFDRLAPDLVGEIGKFNRSKQYLRNLQSARFATKPVKENTLQDSYLQKLINLNKVMPDVSKTLSISDSSKAFVGSLFRNTPIGKVYRKLSLMKRLREMEKNPVYANGGLVGRYNMGGMAKPKYFANGGMVGMYAKGGDVVPSMLTPGEFVVSQPAVKKFGAGNLESINNGSYGGGSKNVNVSNNGTNSANSVYNSYSVNINVSGESANPEALAKVVLKEIKKVSSQGIRGV